MGTNYSNCPQNRTAVLKGIRIKEGLPSNKKWRTGPSLLRQGLHICDYQKAQILQNGSNIRSLQNTYPNANPDRPGNFSESSTNRMHCRVGVDYKPLCRSWAKSSTLPAPPNIFYSYCIYMHTLLAASPFCEGR